MSSQPFMMPPIKVVLLLLLCVSTCHAASMPEEPGNLTLTIGLLGSFSWHWYLGTQDASAIIPAIQDIHEYQLLPGYNIEWTWRENDCDPLTGKH